MDIIEKIISSIPNCSKITNDDKLLYKEFLKLEEKKYPYHYSRSWVFIKKISQGAGIKYFDKQKGHLITIAPNFGGIIPNYVFLPLGIKSIESIPLVAKELNRVLDQKIIVKKIYGEENKEYLLKHGFRDISSIGSVNLEKKYPEVVCSVDEIIKATFGFPTNLKMSRFKKCIRKIRKKIILRGYEIQEKNLIRKLTPEFKNLVDHWSSDITEREATQFKNNMSILEIKKWIADAYYPYFINEYANKVDNKNIIAYLTFLDKNPVAFTSAYSVGRDCLAVNASFCDTNYSGLIQYQFFSLAARAKFLGYKYLNLGSSDFERQHLYKSSMGKINEVYIYNLELE